MHVNEFITDIIVFTQLESHAYCSRVFTVIVDNIIKEAL